jgi:hypothetical protein
MDEGRKEKEEEKKEVECDFHICGISLLSSTHTQGEEKKVDGKTPHTHPEQQAKKKQVSEEMKHGMNMRMREKRTT